MNKWFLRGNSRRFYRIDMPVHAYIAPTSPIKDLEIYATGTDYFPPTTLNLIQKQLSETRYWLDKIQDQKELLEPLFNEIIACIEFLGKGTENISKGINPRNSPDYWLSIKQMKQGFKTVDALQKSAPKTYTYFKLIEDKYLSFLNAFANSIENSTPQKVAARVDIPHAFKIEE
ncbi:MAG TPA: PilZ domain-containing protein, partial [Thiomicrospira sp.]|nr:PilZ domain-containing protein [Thiomicrospira sp.]